MTVAVALAGLALLQVVLPSLFERVFGGGDRPWFVDLMKARGADGLGLSGTATGPGGIADVFTESAADRGAARTRVVLEAAGLVRSARLIAASLAVTLFASFVTVVLALTSNESALIKGARTSLLAISWILSLSALLLIVGRIHGRTLVTAKVGQARYRSPARLVWFWIRTPELPQRYVLAGTIANALTIAAAFRL